MNINFDDDSQKLIEEAKEEMFKLKHPYVGSEHLLLAILNNSDLDITKELNHYGIFYELFKNKLIDSVGSGKKNSNWYLFTPLLKDIINNAADYSGDGIIRPKELLISLLMCGDGVANRILLSSNIDICELCSRIYGSNVELNNIMPFSIYRY